MKHLFELKFVLDFYMFIIFVLPLLPPSSPLQQVQTGTFDWDGQSNQSRWGLSWKQSMHILAQSVFNVERERGNKLNI